MVDVYARSGFLSENVSSTNLTSLIFYYTKLCRVLVGKTWNALRVTPRDLPWIS
jgi:hypothetical protein